MISFMMIDEMVDERVSVNFFFKNINKIGFYFCGLVSKQNKKIFLKNFAIIFIIWFYLTKLINASYFYCCQIHIHTRYEIHCYESIECKKNWQIRRLDSVSRNIFKKNIVHVDN